MGRQPRDSIGVQRTVIARVVSVNGPLGHAGEILLSLAMPARQLQVNQGHARTSDYGEFRGQSEHARLTF